MANQWQIFVDTGGTFTDCLGVSPTGETCRTKVLSNSSLRADLLEVLEDGSAFRFSKLVTLPNDFFVGFQLRKTGSAAEGVAIASYDAAENVVHLVEKDHSFQPGDLIELISQEEPPVLGARVLTQTPLNESLPPLTLRLGTTRGTNALLERKGARVAFFVTQGLGDLLEIGNQQRPDLFALDIKKPPMLYTTVCEVSERLDASGNVLQKLEEEEAHVRATARDLLAQGIDVAAVTLLHSYANTQHETLLKTWLLDEGFQEVVTSAELVSAIKILPRAHTALVNAYLAPIMNAYLNNVEGRLGEGSFHVMTSAGGLVPRVDYRPKDSLLSGPAGGVVGAMAVGKRAGHSKVIAFDMGGTSTDVSRSAGDFEYQSRHQVGDAEVLAPALKIETVAAGGGSVCGFSGHTLFVGPESAGASPGPASYGAGGPLTITDVNLLLGRLNPDAFGIPVSIGSAEKRLNALVAETGQARDALLQGFFDIANERMSDAIKKISISEGYAPSEYAMVAFGGAGGMHACAVSDNLEIETILFPADAGLLSAYGLQQAAVERFESKQILRPLNEIESSLSETIQTLEGLALEKLKKEFGGNESLFVRKRTLELRLMGQESTLSIDVNAESDSVAKLFQAKYEKVFGYFPQGRAIEVVTVQVVAASKSPAMVEEHFSLNKDSFVSSHQRRALFDGEWVNVPQLERCDLLAGDWIQGPAVLSDAFSALVIESGWRAVMGTLGTLKLEKLKAQSDEVARTVASELVQLELYTNRFRSIVEEMGLQLQRTALSTNVKERLDFSCALLDAQGRLIANAPHIPVHLGAMGMCVRTVMTSVQMEPGDVVITNHPGYGGSHLPDVTVITPVHDEAGVLLGFVANRAHHAEIGGKRPGSMPPEASCLAEEGVVIAPMFLFKKGKSCFEAVELVLRDSAYPSRAVDDNLADIRAQVAANRRGADALRALVAVNGKVTVFQFMNTLRSHAVEAIQSAFQSRLAESVTAVECLDDGAEIHVSITHEEERICIDFLGTSERYTGNLNATPAIVQSAIIYVLRLLVDEDIPLNDGLVENIDVRLPHCFLNPDFSKGPTQSPAVVGGNVETSQRLVDTLIKALGIAACSQGTMNNFVFGNERCSYYETICGGAGATANAAGACAVHTHMTNTAITDPEILEHRYPVRLKRFSIRKESGGQGMHRGGDGIVREVEFLEQLDVSLITQHRETEPYGVAGGDDGKPGKQVLIDEKGANRALSSIAHFTAKPGERLVIETPGGGGWGKAED